MAKSIQILEEKTNGFAINTSELFSILDSVSDKRIAVVSINGNKRTGKSFLLNYFLRYLYAKEVESGNWVYGDSSETVKGFEWRGGPERHTVGIWMWSEPFVITVEDGSEIALLLLDTQGNFDEKTTLNECAIIFALSAFLSSTMIFNMTKDISEDKLQFVEFFASFAESFSGETNFREKLFQKLVFLVRDWENESWYPYGCHDNKEPQVLNYKKDMMDPNKNQCKEAQNTRKQILSFFDDVKCFLLPHPGRNVSKFYFKGQTELIDVEFIDYLKEFVPLIVSAFNLEAKKVFGEYVTGNSLKAYLTKWADIIDTEKFPEVKTFASAVAEVNQMLAFKEAMHLYETKIKECFEMKPTDEEFSENHKTIEAESNEYFMNKPKGHISEEKKNELIEFLSARINQIFEVYRSSNLERIEKEKVEHELICAIECHDPNDIQDQSRGKNLSIRLLAIIKRNITVMLMVSQFIIAILFGYYMINKMNGIINANNEIVNTNTGIINTQIGIINTTKSIQNATNENRNLINSLESNQVPVGFIYFQLPSQPQPSQIWSKLNWDDVTASYSGMFFRAEGNNTLPFGHIQEHNAPRLSVVQRRDDGNACTDGKVDAFVGQESAPIKTGNWNVGVKYCLSFTMSGGEVRPRNQAIRIWKRVS